MIPPPGSALPFGASAIKLNDKGEIAKERRYFDTGSFLAQLGLGG
jgi:hypothetical protein